MSDGQRACLLDTTALLAHFRNESGASQVQAILDDRTNDVLISAVSITEFARRLQALGASLAEARTITLEYTGLADMVVPVDAAVAIQAFELGSACTARLPLADALIAACASEHEAVLVHRDPHFDGIPDGLLAKEKLEA
ncbi:MAG: PIN domain-containing protein [Spirochaetota bacterium]